MTVAELRAKMDAKRTELRAIHEAANGGPLSADAEQRWAAGEAELAALAATERRQALVDAHERA